MFTSLNEQVGAGFKKGNDAIKEAYDAVKEIPTQFQNEFASAKSWVLELPTITTSSRGPNTLDSTILMSFPTMTLGNLALSSPWASAPSFSAGTAYPFYPGSNTAPYYSIYGMSGHASYSSDTLVGQASGYLSYTAPPSLLVTKETLTAYASYSTGTGGIGATTSIVGNYEKVLANGERDSWSANLQLNAGQWSGTLSAASNRGPVSVSGNVTFSNGQIVMQTFSCDYAISNHELHVGYSKALRDGEYHVTSGASYRNTEFANTTLMADYGYDSKVGTKILAGAGYWYDQKNYLGVVVGSNTPLVGPATTTGKLFGSVRTNNPLLTLQVSATISNQNINDASSLMFTDSIPSHTPFFFRSIFLDSYQSTKDGLGLGFQGGWGY